MNFDPPRSAEILLVEEDEEDIQLMTAAFAAATARNSLHAVRDGDNAMAYLRRQNEHALVPRPDLILLDLNLTGKNGYDVLREIKADVKFRRIPVIALMNSESDEDILKAYQLNVNSYILKPSDHAALTRMVRGIEEFWLTVVRLPKE